MKIAIQGHPTRGKEVIQILESLGGINDGLHEGNNPDCYYELHGNIIWCVSTKGINFKYYTLEEFEQEFPFKIGDKVTFKNENFPYTIKSFAVWSDGDIACEFEENGLRYPLNKLKSYKEMKEKRNITLTLEKAKEWYKKGGELKEVALQAYSKEELTKSELPRTWEEFCENHPVKTGESWIGTQDFINVCKSDLPSRQYKNWIPSKESAEAHLAMIQLEQLRNCWRQGWKPNWLEGNVQKYVIQKWRDKISIETTYVTHSFLSFPTYEMAKEFLEYFSDLIEKAGDLI